MEDGSDAWLSRGGIFGGLGRNPNEELGAQGLQGVGVLGGRSSHACWDQESWGPEHHKSAAVLTAWSQPSLLVRGGVVVKGMFVLEVLHELGPASRGVKSLTHPAPCKQPGQESV